MNIKIYTLCTSFLWIVEKWLSKNTTNNNYKKPQKDNNNNNKNNNNNNDNNDDFHTVQDLQKGGRVIIIIDGYGQTTLNQTIQGLVVQSLGLILG